MRQASCTFGMHVQFYMTTADAAAEANCTVTLYDSQNTVTDEAVVVFSVNATVVDDQAVSDGTREELTDDDMPERRNCRDRCGLVNVPCMIWRRCGSALATLLGSCIAMLLTCAIPRPAAERPPSHVVQFCAPQS